MRRARIKPRNQITVFHCMSRTVGGQFLLGDVEKEHFRRLMWNLAAFCEMQILTYTVLSNHFHIETRAPAQVHITDQALLAKLVSFYGPKSAQVAEFQSALTGQKPRLASLRQQYLTRLGDVSIFMKELKQGFSRWYNKRHERYGTLWAERFRSTIVENQPSALLTVAAYVDLNAVRAGLVEDPKDYRFCGYAEALAREGSARAGLARLWPEWGWGEFLAEYRKYLFGTAGRAGHSGKKILELKAIQKVHREGGQLSVAELLRLRVRYFTDGVVIGAEGFVEEVFQQFYKKYVPKRRTGARRMRAGDWGGLRSMRDLRKEAVG